jgi:hypothetical protein
VRALRQRVDHLLHHFLGHAHHVDVVSVHVEPRAVDEEGDVLREVEAGRDGEEAAEQEDDGP